MDLQQFVVSPNKKVELAKINPDFSAEWNEEAAAREAIAHANEQLKKYQDMLFAHEAHAVVMIFQGMDGSGKDEAIGDVLSHIDPQGCKATKFDAPTEGELKHDYLRRFIKALPECGQIGIYNRSYYENLVGDRIHRDRVKQWKMQPKAKGDELWQQRFREVNNMEQYLSDNGYLVLKFFLHVSKEQQRKRLLERLCDPHKQWQFSMSDMEDRRRWNQFQEVYEETLSHTSTQAAPWNIIPSDHRWFAHLAIASIVAEGLKSLHQRYPALDKEQKEQMTEAQRVLEREAKS